MVALIGSHSFPTKTLFGLLSSQDLYRRLDSTRFFPPLEDSQFHYGFNSTHLKHVVSYWRNSFEWRKQVERINKYPHYKTTIEGLDVHFVHVKPAHLAPGQKARPLLMVHGWPGSFYEFYRIIPLLTEPAKHGLNPNLVFEIICPSIPGYGFSEAPHKKGEVVVDQRAANGQGCLKGVQIVTTWTTTNWVGLDVDSRARWGQ
eukprot:XP_017946110.1 PREDICTED: epoxide hydrolase 1-like [Xenopus tropicalis]